MNERLIELVNLISKKSKQSDSKNLKKIHKSRIEELFFSLGEYDKNDFIDKLIQNGIPEKALSDTDRKEINEYVENINKAKHNHELIMNEFRKMYPDWDEYYNPNEYYSNDKNNWMYIDKKIYDKMSASDLAILKLEMSDKKLIQKIKNRILKNNDEYKNKEPIDSDYLYKECLTNNDEYYKYLKTVTIRTFPKITIITSNFKFTTFKLNIDSDKEFERIRKMYLVNYISKAKELIQLRKEVLKSAIEVDEYEVLIDKSKKNKIISLSDSLINICNDFNESIAKLDKRSKDASSFSFY